MPMPFLYLTINRIKVFKFELYFLLFIVVGKRKEK